MDLWMGLPLPTYLLIVVVAIAPPDTADHSVLSQIAELCCLCEHPVASSGLSRTQRYCALKTAVVKASVAFYVVP
ncbi:hypothetical protein P167DRAFT_510529 [Morchella conica CCBAS932]|uniref:Secreted protein n=1 Tax=Morchella conica CCBAS932 TaxID=1392247 RepID=A0A3N4KGC7_9PEZI|nr:hypothetical protein P167DRAFT_510529 [Morchella conica CCBAS932]